MENLKKGSPENRKIFWGIEKSEKLKMKSEKLDKYTVHCSFITANSQDVKC